MYLFNIQITVFVCLFVCFVLNSGALFQGTDGYDIDTFASTGELEIFAWKHISVKPFLTSFLHLGPSVPVEVMEQPFQKERTLDDMFVRVWVSLKNVF